LDELTDPNQTAYVKGKSVTDNFRSILFMKDHCIEDKVDTVLINLDAKKAFDSASHQHTETILTYYGFGPKFINCFEPYTAKCLKKYI
jgi:hypothetical protein